MNTPSANHSPASINSASPACPAETPHFDSSAAPRRRRAARLVRMFGWRRILLASAALPMLQATGCFPDPIGAVNFELQRLISNTLINAFNIIVRNILDL